MSKNKLSKTIVVSVRLDEENLNLLDTLAKKKKKSKSSIARQIIKDYFIKKRADSLEDLIDKAERVFPDLEKKAYEYQKMKEVLKQTVEAVHETASTVRELKRSEYLTYTTLKKLVDDIRD